MIADESLDAFQAYRQAVALATPAPVALNGPMW
jgi:hypothetical protein